MYRCFSWRYVMRVLLYSLLNFLIYLPSMLILFKEADGLTSYTFVIANWNREETCSERLVMTQNCLLLATNVKMFFPLCLWRRLSDLGRVTLPFNLVHPPLIQKLERQYIILFTRQYFKEKPSDKRDDAELLSFLTGCSNRLENVGSTHIQKSV